MLEYVAEAAFWRPRRGRRFSKSRENACFRAWRRQLFLNTDQIIKKYSSAKSWFRPLETCWRNLELF
jgi:hypothetical protein